MIVSHYELVARDIEFFRSILWHVVVLDDSVAVLVNEEAVHMKIQLMSLNARQRIVSCNTLLESNSNETISTLPDISCVIFAIFPPVWSILCDHDLGGVLSNGILKIDEKTQQFLIKLLCSLTVVCDENLSKFLVSDYAESDAKLYSDLMDILPALEWSGVHYHISKSLLASENDIKPLVRSINFHVSYNFPTVTYGSHYLDEDIMEELKAVENNSDEKSPKMSGHQKKRAGRKSVSIAQPVDGGLQHGPVVVKRRRRSKATDEGTNAAAGKWCFLVVNYCD
jgi:hypothetical protein